jgi:ribonuclease Z
MARLTLLGSSAALTDAAHDNVYMVLSEQGGAWLIDCAGSPVQRLTLAGIPVEALKGLIVTHHHPDHTYGLPILLLDLWLLGLRPLPIYGLPESLEFFSRLMALYEPDEWARWFIGHPIAPQERTPVLSTEEVEVIASPVKHSIPAIGLRITSRITGRAIAYSSDTEPCAAVALLAAGADILLHEATGVCPGHSTGAGAAEIARRAGAKRLVLIHYPVVRGAETLKEAREAGNVPVELAEDFKSYEL